MKQNSWTPLPLFIREGVDFSEFSEKAGWGEVRFSHKKRGVGKIEVCFKKGGITCFILTLFNAIFL